MNKIQYSKFHKSPIAQITAIWTICFLLWPLISLGVGQALGNVSWSMEWTMRSRDPWRYIFFGLVIAEPMSGLLTALILQRSIPRLRFHHIFLFTLGWGITASISWILLSFLAASD